MKTHFLVSSRKKEIWEKRPTDFFKSLSGENLFENLENFELFFATISEMAGKKFVEMPPFCFSASGCETELPWASIVPVLSGFCARNLG